MVFFNRRRGNSSRPTGSFKKERQMVLTTQSTLYIKEHNILRRKDIERRTRQFLDILTQTIRDEFMSGLNADPSIQRWVEKIGNLELDQIGRASCRERV